MINAYWRQHLPDTFWNRNMILAHSSLKFKTMPEKETYFIIKKIK